jgi:hypothetical protein
MKTKLSTELPTDSLDESSKLLRGVVVRPQRLLLADLLKLVERDFIKGWEDHEKGVGRSTKHTTQFSAYKVGHDLCREYYVSSKDLKDD